MAAAFGFRFCCVVVLVSRHDSVHQARVVLCAPLTGQAEVERGR